jgi:hypothetical protein
LETPKYRVGMALEFPTNGPLKVKADVNSSKPERSHRQTEDLTYF